MITQTVSSTATTSNGRTSTPAESSDSVHDAESPTVADLSPVESPTDLPDDQTEEPEPAVTAEDDERRYTLPTISEFMSQPIDDRDPRGFDEDDWSVLSFDLPCDEKDYDNRWHYRHYFVAAYANPREAVERALGRIMHDRECGDGKKYSVPIITMGARFLKDYDDAEIEADLLWTAYNVGLDHAWTAKQKTDAPAYPAGNHVVTLTDADGNEEAAFNGTAEECIDWVQKWLVEPLGMKVAIVPPQETAAVRAIPRVAVNGGAT